MKTAKDTFCSFCGTKYADRSRYPRACAACGTMVWNNPIPVTVVIQPVRSRQGDGVLVVRRGRDPKAGELALPGGFMDIETPEEGASRELREETGIAVLPKDLRQLWVRSSTVRTQINVFCIAPPIAEEDVPSSDRIVEDSQGEVTEMRVLFAPEELAFPSHTEALRWYFAADAGSCCGGHGPCRKRRR